PEVHRADVPSAAGMASDDHHQPLPLARRLSACMFPQAEIVAQGTTLKNVVPGGDGERRELDVLVVLLNGPLLPVAVVGRVGQPIEKVGSQPGSQRGGTFR